MIFPVPRGRDDYRRELNNAIRSNFYVEGFLHIFDQVWDEGVEEVDYEKDWHMDVYRLGLDEQRLAIDSDGMMHFYYGTDKGIVVFNETQEGVEIDYPSALQPMISEVFSEILG
jgi:hypothetical protein